MVSSATATQTGQQISTPGFNTGAWLAVTNDDADAPGTEINALLQNGACPNVFFSNNMQTCFGRMTKIGPDTIAQFSVPWWFRTDFTANLSAGQVASLIVNGVVGKADVFVDGTQVATSTTVTGAYTRFTFDVTGVLLAGTNSLAIKVYPNDPTTLFTVSNVDWSQIPPDNNTGIQFPVQLQVTGALADTNAHVLQSTAADLSSSALTVKSDIVNGSARSQSARPSRYRQRLGADRRAGRRRYHGGTARVHVLGRRETVDPRRHHHAAQHLRGRRGRRATALAVPVPMPALRQS